MPQSLIKQIAVDGLFGKFSYEIPRDGALESPAILYGDNGVGKSTILNLVFHMLSSANDRGHRNALRKVSFRRFSVLLSNGYSVVASRDGEIDNEIIDLSISHEGHQVANWVFYPPGSSREIEERSEFIIERIKEGGEASLRDMRLWLESGNNSLLKRDASKRGQLHYLEMLGNIAPRIFYLNADRKLDGDTVTDASDAADLRRMVAAREVKAVSDLLRASRGISLTQALENAARWVNRRAVTDLNRGSENTHSAYEAIIDQLSVNYNEESLPLDDTEMRELSKLIASVEKDTKDLSKFGLAAELRMDKFEKVLKFQNRPTATITARLIRPYVTGIVTRLDAIKPLYDVLDNFVSKINEFFQDKILHFSLSQGFFIVDSRANIIAPDQLSSGEQQLLLIFAYVLSSRDNPSVFIIDEPEISLNVKWQRKIVGALLSVAEGSSIQFVFASHSLELISQHSNCVVEIGR